MQVTFNRKDSREGWIQEGKWIMTWYINHGRKKLNLMWHDEIILHYTFCCSEILLSNIFAAAWANPLLCVGVSVFDLSNLRWCEGDCGFSEVKISGGNVFTLVSSIAGVPSILNCRLAVSFRWSISKSFGSHSNQLHFQLHNS